MAIDLLINRKSPGMIGKLELDATIRESHHYTNEVTDFPIENGSKISDHVIRKPEEVELNGIITNSPISYKNLLTIKMADRVADSYLILLALAGFDLSDKVVKNGKLVLDARNSAKLQFGKIQTVDIITSIRQYTNMIIIDLDIPKDAKTGDALYFTAKFKRITTVNVAEVDRTPDTISGKKATTAPKQAASTASQAKGGVKKLVSQAKQTLNNLHITKPKF